MSKWGINELWDDPVCVCVCALGVGLLYIGITVISAHDSYSCNDGGGGEGAVGEKGEEGGWYWKPDS